jgi:hypothetical protein
VPEAEALAVQIVHVEHLELLHEHALYLLID